MTGTNVITRLRVTHRRGGSSVRARPVIEGFHLERVMCRACARETLLLAGVTTAGFLAIPEGLRRHRHQASPARLELP